MQEDDLLAEEDGPAEVYADEEVTPDMMLSDADRALPGDGIPDGDRPMQGDDLLAEEDGPAEVYADEDVTPDMMLSDADRAIPGDGIAANDKAMPGDDLLDKDGPGEVYADDDVTPEMMLSDADRALPGDGIAANDKAMPEDELLHKDGPGEVYADEEVTPEMMLSDADRALPGDGIAANDKAMPEDELLHKDGPGEVYADEEVTPEMMLSDADRALPPDQMAAPVAAEPAPARPPAPVVAAPRDDSMPDFPVTKYNEQKGAVVAKTEAPKAAPKPPTELPVTIKSDGLFGFDRADLGNELVIKLDAVADMLSGARYDKIIVVGHADPIGSAKYNQGLSERRAEAVKKYLSGKGVDGSRIQTAGKGESELVVTYKDCAGKRKKALIACFEPNRRVVIDAAGTKPSK